MIEQELDAASCVIALWTNHSVTSEWVRNEAADGARRRILIPIRLDDVRLPLAFRHLQTSDLFAWTATELDDCCCSIEAMIGTAAKREPDAIPVAHPIVPPAQASPSDATAVHGRHIFGVALAVVLAVFAIIVIAAVVRNESKIVATDTAMTDIASTDLTSADFTATDTAAPSTTGTMLMPETAAARSINSVSSTKVVDLETTRGTITIELLPELAPHHVRNFLQVAHSGGFDGAPIYLVVDIGFAAGYESSSGLEQEPNDIAFRRGTVLGMSQSPYSLTDSNTQLWITASDALNLDRKRNTAFGRVIAGMDVVDQIISVPVDSNNRPVMPIKITRAVARSR